MAKLRVKRKTYRRRDGTRVMVATYLTRDRGKKGRTPKSQRWYHPKVETGWEKDMPQDERIELVVRAHDGDLLASARSMQALSNVTVDRATKSKAASDAKVLFRRYAQEK